MLKIQHRQAFRRHIQNFDLLLPKTILNILNALKRKTAIDQLCRNSIRLQSIHLIFHERNQGRNHQRQPRHLHRRKLVTQ